MPVRLITTLVILGAIAFGIVASFFMRLNQSIALSIGIVGVWFLILGLTKTKLSFVGLWPSNVNNIWWGGVFISLSISWFLSTYIQRKIAIVIFIIGIMITLLIANLKYKKINK